MIGELRTIYRDSYAREFYPDKTNCIHLPGLAKNSPTLTPTATQLNRRAVSEHFRALQRRFIERNMKTIINSIVIIALSLISCNKVKYKTFISSDGWLEIKYPTLWNHSEVDKGTYLFKNDMKWSGNFRVTPLKVSGVDKNLQPFNIDNYILDEINKNPGAKLILIGKYKTVNYFLSTIDDNVPITVQNWIFGQDNIIIIASYTAPTNKLNDRRVKREIEFCKRSIETLKIK